MHSIENRRINNFSVPFLPFVVLEIGEVQETPLFQYVRDSFVLRAAVR